MWAHRIKEHFLDSLRSVLRKPNEGDNALRTAWIEFRAACFGENISLTPCQSFCFAACFLVSGAGVY